MSRQLTQLAIIIYKPYDVIANTELDTIRGTIAHNMLEMVVLVVAFVERWTRDRKIAGSTPGRGAIKSTRSTPSLRGR